MKPILVLMLVLSLLLLCACDGIKVPVHEAASSETTASSEASVTPATTSTALTYEPTGKNLLRLTRFYHCGEEYVSAFDKLQSYDPQLDKWQTMCNKENCPHVDENCDAWLGLDVNSLYFAAEEGIAYCVYGPANDYGNLTELEFFTLDLITGQRRSYHKAAAPENGEIILCDAAVCGSKAVLSYSMAADEVEHSVLAFDLASGEMTAVLQRELPGGVAYNLWGVSEDHVLLAVHSISGEPYSIAQQEHTANYKDYVMRLHRWVILEYPIEENAKWSKQVAESTAGSELRLFSYNSFYRGALYYVLNDSLWFYDMESHLSRVLFRQEGITSLSCFDGRIFFTTEEGAYYACKLSGGGLVHLPQEKGRVFFITGENEDYFYGNRTIVGGTPAGSCYMIAKDDFYKGSVHSLVLLTP